MAYNLSLINSTGFSSLTRTVNEQLMFGYYGVGFLITLTIILFMSFYGRTQEFKSSLGISLFFSSVLSIFMRIWSLVSDVHVLVFWILTGIVGMVMFFTQE